MSGEATPFVSFLGVSPRFQPADFLTYSEIYAKFRALLLPQCSPGAGLVLVRK